MIPSPFRGPISIQTKTIKKSNSTFTNQHNHNKIKKYQTFDVLKKGNILNDLWKGAIQILKLDLNVVSCTLLELLGGISLNQYNALLRKTLAKHVEGFINSNKVLTQWRKKVKSWVQNQGKPETRGGLVVPVDTNNLFRNRIIEILLELPFRCFPTLRQKAVVVLEEFHNEAQGTIEPTALNPNTCSKHWWFNFIKKNTDIKDMWEKLPLERTYKKQQRNFRLKSNSPVLSDISSKVVEEAGNLSLNAEARTVSTIEDYLEDGSRLSSPPTILCQSYQENCFGIFNFGLEMKKAPEAPLRYFKTNHSKSSLLIDKVAILRGT